MTSDQSPSAEQPRRLPPSFTPQPRQSGRPSATDDAIAIGNSGKERPSGGRIGRPDDAVPLAPRVQRQSSREIPITPPRAGKAPEGSPRTIPPRSAPPQSIRPGRGSARAVPAPAPAHDGATRVGSVPAARQSPVRQTPARPAPVRPASGRGAASRPGVAAARPAVGRPQGGGLRVRRRRVAGLVALVVVAGLVAWPVGLLMWADGKLQHVDALSGASGSSGTTYLLAGSDARGDGISEDGTTGARTDTIMVLHKPGSGPASLISLPRDTYVEIPGYGGSKLNAAYSYGGAPLLVQTVEGLTGLTVDHYVEIGFGGVQGVVDALGGVELCLDYDVNDYRSELVWTAGCHVADGHTALAFSRMRYSDPTGDIGRAERQRQVISAVSAEAADSSLLYRPADQVALIDAGIGALVVDQRTGIVDLGFLALAFKSATGPKGVTGTPPISNPDYRPGDAGSTVQLDPETVGQFWVDVRDGNLEPGSTVGGLPQ